MMGTQPGLPGVDWSGLVPAAVYLVVGQKTRLDQVLPGLGHPLSKVFQNYQWLTNSTLGSACNRDHALVADPFPQEEEEEEHLLGWADPVVAALACVDSILAHCVYHRFESCSSSVGVTLLKCTIHNTMLNTQSRSDWSGAASSAGLDWFCTCLSVRSAEGLQCPPASSSSLVFSSCSCAERDQGAPLPPGPRPPRRSSFYQAFFTLSVLP